VCKSVYGGTEMLEVDCGELIGLLLGFHTFRNLRTTHPDVMYIDGSSV